MINTKLKQQISYLFNGVMSTNNRVISTAYHDKDRSSANKKSQVEEVWLSQDSDISFTALMDMIDRNEIEYEIPVRSQMTCSVAEDSIIENKQNDQIDEAKWEIEEISDPIQEESKSAIENNVKERKVECEPERIVFPEELQNQPVEHVPKPIPTSIIWEEPTSLSNYCEFHKLKFTFMDLNSKRLLWQKCLNSLNSDEGIASLLNIAMEKISKWKDTFDFALKHVKDCEEMDIEKWKWEIRNDIHSYFDFVNSNMNKLKEEALKEVKQIFEHKIIGEVSQKKQFIKNLQGEITDKLNYIHQEIISGNYSSVTRKDKLLDNLEKTLLLLTIESKQYQSKVIRRQAKFDSLISKIKAMIFKIDDALYSTVFSKVPDIERSKFEDLFKIMKIRKEVPQKSDVTPLYCYYREFIKDKNLSPLQGWLQAIYKWDKIDDSRKNIFFTIAKQHNDSWLEAIINKANNIANEEIKINKTPINDSNIDHQRPLNRKEKLMKHLEDCKKQEQQISSKDEDSSKFYEKYETPQELLLQRYKKIKDSVADDEWSLNESERKPHKNFESEILKIFPANLNVIEKRILQKEIEKRLEPTISSQIKSFENMNSKKREEKNRLKLEGDELNGKKYEKSQLTRIHRIMKTIS